MMLVDIDIPHQLDKIVGQDKIIATSKRWIGMKDMPHVILVGPPGCGKSTWARAMASEMFGGVDLWNEKHNDFREFNASDERGIDVVRGEIKDFASAGPAKDVPFRIVFLDEADKITGDAQHAMRNTVERYSDRCRFIMSGNRADYIEPMVSRAATFRFQAIPPEPFAKRIQEVAIKAGIHFDKDDGMNVMNAIIDYYKGDLRKAINDCLEKLRGIDHPVIMNDLDFGNDISSVITTIKKILVDDITDSPKMKYEGARAFFEREHARLQFDIRDFIKHLHDAIGVMSLPVARAFSEVDDRIRAGGTKDVHVGYLLAVIADGGNK